MADSVEQNSVRSEQGRQKPQGSGLRQNRISKANPDDEDDGEFEPLRVIRKGGKVIVRDMPLVDEHPVYGDDGKFLLNCDERILRWIAANNNKRVRETGDKCPVSLGHTKDDADEKDQPPIVGYTEGFYVAPLVNPDTHEETGRQAIYARTTTFDESDVEKYDLKRFPRRSVEIWFDKDPIIDPVSLLSSTTPERDLGLMRLSRNGKRWRAACPGRMPVLKRSRVGMISDNDDLIARVTAGIMEMAPMRFLEQLMSDPGMMRTYLAAHDPKFAADQAELNEFRAEEQMQEQQAAMMMPPGEQQGEEAGLEGQPTDGEPRQTVDEGEQEQAPTEEQYGQERSSRRSRKYARRHERLQADMGDMNGDGGEQQMYARKPKLGSGKRFAEVEHEAAESGAKDPAAVAAAAGRAKYGNKRMAEMAAAGKKKNARPKDVLDDGRVMDLDGDARRIKHARQPDELEHDIEHTRTGAKHGMQYARDGYYGEDEVEDTRQSAEHGMRYKHENELAGYTADDYEDEEGGTEETRDDEVELQQELEDESVDDSADIEREMTPHDGAAVRKGDPRVKHSMYAKDKEDAGAFHEEVEGRQFAHDEDRAQGQLEDEEEYVSAEVEDEEEDEEDVTTYQPLRHSKEAPAKIVPDQYKLAGGKAPPKIVPDQYKLDKHGRPVRRSAAAGSPAMAGSSPAGGNTFTPSSGYGEHEEKRYHRSLPEIPQMLHNSRKVKRMRTSVVPQEELSVELVNELRNQLDATQNKLDSALTKLARTEEQQGVLIRNARHRAFRERLARRRGDLLQLETEGVVLDINEEMGEPDQGLAYILSPEQWDSNVERIRRRYSRAPISGRMPFADMPMRTSGGPQKATTKAEMYNRLEASKNATGEYDSKAFDAAMANGTH